MSDKPVIICLTPVKNEAWILDTFLKCTSLWADHIIIADQDSTDGSKEIALKFPKVHLINNSSDDYDENFRQKLLLSEARKINGRRLLIALDADEIFTSDFAETNDWQRLLNAKEGDVFGFRWINISRDFRQGWLSGHFGWAFMDDSSEHVGKFIHSPRIPVRNPESIIKLEQIRVLHFQFANWERMLSKHRYYQCLERINNPHRNAVDVFRMYHHMLNIKRQQLKPLEYGYFKNYEDKGIMVRQFTLENDHWFDREILRFFDKYGAEAFRKESIWDVDWNKKAMSMQFPQQDKINEPRKFRDRIFHLWLNNTQKFKETYLIRKADSMVKRFW